MRSSMWCMVVMLCCSQGLLAGRASGSYQDSGQEFSIGYAVAERADDGTVRILLTRQEPELPDRDHHLDRLEALAEVAQGGYLMLEPTAEGDGFNMTASVDELPYGSGGQYESAIAFSEMGAAGKIASEVLNNARLEVEFEAEYIAARTRLGDLPAGGGSPGAVFLAQIQALASGDREAILATLEPEQQEQFEQMSTEEQAEALSFWVDLTPRNVRITDGGLYDGYAIVHFAGETEGEPVTGMAMVAQEGDQWRILEVSTTF